MKQLQSLLKEFDDILKKYNPVNYEMLQNPLSKKEITEYLKKIEIDDRNFELLFEWKNGFNLKGSSNKRLQLFDFGAMLPLDSILKSKMEDNDLWNKKFLPLISSGEGSFILFNKKNGKDYGKLHLHSVGFSFLDALDEPISYYDSIYTMIMTTMEAYKEGALIYNENENSLDEDVDAFNKLAKKYNTKADFWKLV